jgi:galactonate dehydratase
MMKIARVEDFHVDGGFDEFCFVKVTADDGTFGWAEYSERRGRRGLTALIHSMGRAITGMDPREINAIDAVLQTQMRTTSGGLQSQAVGALLNALLDILGKARGLPVHALFGGAVRDRIPVYWSRCGVIRAAQAHLFDGKVIDKPAIRRVEDLVAAGREARERGYRAIKCNLLVFDEKGGHVHTPGSQFGTGHPELNIEEDLVEALVAQLSALQEGAGPKVRLIVDLNFNYKTEGFRRLAKAVEPFNLMWLEMDLHDPQGLALIRASTTTPVGSLETIMGRKPLRPYLEHRSVDVAIIDPQYNGLPESIRMASMCDAYDINVASHGFAGPLASVMSAHFCAVIPNLRIMEFDVDGVPWREEILTKRFEVKDGYFPVPQRPGWGTSLDEDVLRTHAVG